MQRNFLNPRGKKISLAFTVGHSEILYGKALSLCEQNKVKFSTSEPPAGSSNVVFLAAKQHLDTGSNKAQYLRSLN